MSDAAADLEVGAAVARSLRHDQPDVAAERHSVRDAREQACPGRAVEEQQRPSVSDAIFGKAEPPAIGQMKNLILRSTGHCFAHYALRKAIQRSPGRAAAAGERAAARTFEAAG